MSLTNGYAIFVKGNWDVSDFFASYVTLAFVVVLYIVGTIYYKEWRFRDVKDIESEILPKIEISEEEERGYDIPVPKNFLEKVWYFII